MVNFWESTEYRNLVHGQVASKQSSKKTFLVTNFIFIDWWEDILCYKEGKSSNKQSNAYCEIIYDLILIIFKYKSEKQETGPMHYKPWDLTQWIKIH